MNLCGVGFVKPSTAVAHYSADSEHCFETPV